MSDDPKKSVEKLIEKLVEEDLAASAEERAQALEAEGVDIEAAAAKARAAIEDAISADAKERKPRKCSRRTADVATTRSTSGAGYAFEDCVAAWLMVRMMAGVPMHGFDAPGLKLQFQAKALGHAIDDLVLTGVDAAGEEITLSISCRSGLDVGPAGFRDDFAEAVWKDWDRLDAPQRTRARFALVTRGQHDGFEKTWADLQDWIGAGVTPLALARIRKTPKHARVFDSLAGDPARDDETIAALAARVLPLSVDFQTANSKDEDGSIERCRAVLASGSWSEAQELWKKLIAKAATARTTSGTIRVADLWAELRAEFALNDHPDFASSWAVLRRVSADCRARVEVALPNGHVMQRETESAELSRLITRRALAAVHGESGVGKSALVASVLEESFADAHRIWFGSEEIGLALTASGRTRLGLRHGLEETLKATSCPRNALVIDAAERLPAEALPPLRQLASSLTAAAEGEEPAWRVVIITQTETGANVRAAMGIAQDAVLELGDVPAEQVCEALRSSERIGWLASHPDAVAALANLSALSFVLLAEPLFESQDGEVSFSKTAIADRLWDWWTGGDAAFGGLLMRLAAREADFERSFAPSELDPADALVLNQRSARAPVRLNRFNRIEFVHDMASDWARYRRLREIAETPDKWAALADNPMWLAALRMLGEVLLREKIDGQPGWDLALQRIGDKVPAARDVLLESLVLDPLADHYLEARAAMLFANDGALLKRLCGRFLHVATRASVPPLILALDPSLSVHFETLHRAPMQTRWPPLIRFLAKHRKQVAKLMSTRVARLCEVWLAGTPQNWSDGTPYAFRKEMAELALASVRALQYAQGTNRYIFTDDTEPKLYRAAFAASPDLPDAVAAWALEMCGRRPMASDVQREISSFRAQEAQKHAERMKTDAEYRERHESARAMGSFASLSERKLPPWPLGPRRRVERDFRSSCLHKGVLNELMKIRPDAAGEILLACIIEDDPKEGRERPLEPELGLAFDMESYPTIYWHSAFVTFLMTAEASAPAWLMKLVQFATERWAAPAKGRVYRVSLDTKDGARKYTGNYAVFNWVDTESASNGQLFSALAALEFWLCARLEGKQDISAVLELILREGGSAALLGVLVNVAKHRPELLQGPLRPLVVKRELHEWDAHRVSTGRAYRFNAMHWSRSGEHAFEMAKGWAFAPRRETTLSEVALTLAFDDAAIAKTLRDASASWQRPDNEKECLELDIRAAQLDVDNYVQDKTGARVFVAPRDLQKRVKAFDDAHAPKRQLLTLPMDCLHLLQGGGPFNEAAAPRLAEIIGTDPATGEDEEEIAQIQAARVAAAGTLVARGRRFLDEHPEVEEQARALIDGVIAEVGGDAESLRRARFDIGGYEVLFAAFAALEIWADDPNEAADVRLLRLISSRRSGVIASLLGVARNTKDRLQNRVKWLETACHLWSALSALSPGYGADDATRKRWERWVGRFRAIRLEKLDGVNIDLVDLSERVDRIGALRAEYDEDEEPVRRRRRRQRYYATGLDNDVLYQIHGRLLDFERRGPVDTADDRAAAIVLWQTQARVLRDRAKDDGEYPLPDKLGYDVLQALGRMTAFAPADEAGPLWRPVFELGVCGHNATDHLLGSWFLQAFNDPDPKHFAAQWRAMAEAVLNRKGWNGDKLRYRSESTLRRVMGFGSDKSLAHLPGAPAMVAAMWDLYETWAEAHLARDDDNISAFAVFLASDVGADIRLRGCQVIAARLDEGGYWRRDHVGQSLVELVDTLINKNADAARTDQAVRDGILRILAVLVAHGVDGALVLQERIRDIR